MLIPSIDLLGGKVVQLQQGQTIKISIEEKPLEFASRFSSFEETQVIDLDAATGRGENRAIVEGICCIVNARVGGGIRSTEKARQLIKAGAKKLIIGTKANKNFLQKLCNEFGKDRIIVALDSRRGKVAVEGWKKTLRETPFERAKELEPYCGEFLYTCIEKEGLMQGIDWQTIKRLKSVTSNKISVAGGIASVKEIRELEAFGVKPVVGMALYSGKIKMSEVYG
jgi:phosphoribosylformimino-5-aminoimidazole carboxamide ribotide isomerase